MCLLAILSVYYQWVPFVLGLQCCLFYVPRVIWQAICYNRTGTDLENIITQSMNAVHSNEKGRKDAADNIAADIEYLLFQVSPLWVIHLLPPTQPF